MWLEVMGVAAVFLAIGISLVTLSWRALRAEERARRLAPFAASSPSYRHFPGEAGVERTFLIPGVMERLSDELAELLVRRFPCLVTYQTSEEIRFRKLGSILLNQPPGEAFSGGHFHLAKGGRGKVLVTYELSLVYLRAFYLCLFGGIAVVALLAWALSWLVFPTPGFLLNAAMFGVVSWSAVWAIWGYRAHKMAVCHAMDGLILSLLRMED